MVKKITRDELTKIMSGAEKFKLVDVLDAEHYQKEHIKGAISLPVGDIEKKAGKMLKKTDKIITYCASFECQASTNAAEKLTSMGYKNVLDYKGGIQDYKEAGLPLEAGLNKTGVNACSACGCGC